MSPPRRLYSKNRTIFLLISLLAPTSLFSQSAQQDSGAYAAAISTFYGKLLPEAHLYYGDEFVPYDYAIKGNAFYPDDSVYLCSIVFGGIAYREVPLRYDIFAGRVVVRSLNNFLLVPEQDQVSYFVQDGHTFLNLPPDTVSPGFPGAGFYEALFQGRERLLARHRKTIQTDLNSQEKIFQEKTSLYLLKGGTYYPVSTEKSFLRLFPDHKPDLQRFMRRNGLHFKDDREGTMKALLSYYDQLTLHS